MKGRRQTETDSNPAKLPERGKWKDREVGRLFDPMLRIRFTTEIPPVQHGKQGGETILGSCLLCQPASRGRVKVLQSCKYINM